jgi:hypothetical protein
VFTERLALFEDSDSEAELEAEAIQLQLQKGKELVKTGNTITAGKFLAAGISKLKHHRSRFLDAERKLFMLDDLLQPLDEQENWPEAKRIRLEKLSVLSSDMTTQSDRYLTETLELVEFLLRARDTHEGRIYARKCIKSYRKLGTDGLKGLKKALTLMISACQLEGDEPEEEVYKAMLVQLNMAPESDLTTVEASEPALPVELDAVSTEISWRSTENMEEAKSFSSKILSALSLKTIDESSQLDPPVSIAARVRRIFRSTVPCAEWYPAALDGDDTGQGNNVDGMIGANLDEYQSIHDSLKLIPVSWTETKDQEAGSLSQRLDPDMDSQDLVSDRTSLICNQHPESEMYAGGSSNQSTQDTTPSIQTEEPSSSEDLNDTKTDIMSIYELDAGPVAAVDTDSTANHGDSRSSSTQIHRAFSWENTGETDTTPILQSDTAVDAIEEAHKVLETKSDVYTEPSVTLSTWVSFMHDASTFQLLESNTRLARGSGSPHSNAGDSSTKIELPFIDIEATVGRESM